MKLPKRIKRIILEYEALKQQVDEMQSEIAKIKLKNSLLTLENESQSKLLLQLTSLVKPAEEKCNLRHAFCKINHRRYNYVSSSIKSVSGPSLQQPYLGNNTLVSISPANVPLSVPEPIYGSGTDKG